MKITRLRTHVVNLPFDPPIGLTPTAFLRSAGLVLVFLESDQGEIGEGLVFSFNGSRLAVLDAMVKSFEPLLIGLDPLASGAFLARAWNEVRSLGAGGIGVLCLGGIDCALWDLRAKLLGVNVAQMLGVARNRIPAYQSSELWVSLSLDQLQRSAADQVKAGFRAMKMRLTGDMRNDLARVRAVREAIGPDVKLLADANQKLDVPLALRLGRALEEFNLTWFEEPVAAHNHQGEAEIAAALDVAIASGESVYTSRGVMEMLQQRCCDVLMPDLLRMGGPTEFMKAAALADGFNIPVSNHTYSEMSVSLLATLPNVNYLECMPWVSGAYREQVELDSEGRAILPDRPGWGYSFDPAVIKRYSLA
jgi:L-alanine-DL-glutamate epimerase-like enolase superfamily enzyme